VVPDIASNIRVDQPWGAAQVMGRLERPLHHQQLLSAC
jgi:hypothetical protein